MPVTKKNGLNRASKAHNKTIKSSKSKRRRNSKKKSIRTSKSKRSRKRSSRKKKKRSSRKKSKKGNSHIMKGGGVTLIEEDELVKQNNKGYLNTDTYYIFLKGFDSNHDKGESISDVYDEQILTDIKKKFNTSQKKNLCVIWDGDSIHDTKFTRLVKKILKLELVTGDPLHYPKVIVSAIAFKKKSETDGKNEINRQKLEDNMRDMRDMVNDVKLCTIEINQDKIDTYSAAAEIEGMNSNYKKFATLALTIYEQFLKLPNFKFSADNCFFVCLGGGAIAMTEMEVLFGKHTIKDIKFSEHKDAPVKLYPVSRKRIEEFPTLLDFFTKKDYYKEYICLPLKVRDSTNLLVDETEILGYQYTNPIFSKITDFKDKLAIMTEKLTIMKDDSMNEKKQTYLKEQAEEFVQMCKDESCQQEIQYKLEILKQRIPRKTKKKNVRPKKKNVRAQEMRDKQASLDSLPSSRKPTKLVKNNLNNYITTFKKL